MKRAVTYLLILSLCFVICACGGAPTAAPETLAPSAESTPKPTPIPTPKPTPKPAKPSTVEVTITTENFFDYFEYRECPESSMIISKDSAGNVIWIAFGSGYYPKDSWSIPKEKLNDCHVEVGTKWNYQYFQNNQGITVDLENHSYRVTGKPTWSWSRDKMEKDTIAQFTDDGPMIYYVLIDTTTLGNGKDYDTYIISDIEFVSASGTLYLYE